MLSKQERIGGSLSIILENRTIERSFLLQRCVDHVNPSTPVIWITTTQVSAILEVSKVAPIIEFFLQQLVAMERFLVEFTTISKKNHKWAYVHSDMIKRCGPLSAVFGKNLRRATFILFLLQLDRLPLTAVCCNRRWVYRQHLTSPIFQCESPQGIPVQVRKWISLVHWQQVNLSHRTTTPTTCAMDWSMWKLTTTSSDSWKLWIEP